jgi:hypothetical protein
MKKLFSVACSSGALLLSLTAWGVPVSTAVKVECMGDCHNIKLSDACQVNGGRMSPYAIACDHPNGAEYNGQYWCGSGSALCENISLSADNTVGAYCDDGAGNDAVVMCTATVELPSPIAAVKVECQGPCDTVTMHDICGPLGLEAVSLSCADTAVGNGWDRSCGNGATCRDWGTLYPSDPLGAYCQDGDGYDAIVTCGLAASTKVVRVECWGSDCMNVSLGQVCNIPATPARQFAAPFQISCDDTASPGTGTVHNPCRYSTGGSTCTTAGQAWSSDLLGAYCGDGDGYDATITCP